MSSSLSSVVRASMGAAAPSMVTDEDLDRHIAQLILKEAKQKAEGYGKYGIRAYLPNGDLPESNAPKANKRFLSSIIRSTDDHNKTILRTQALAAQEIKRAREEEERRERKARAEEAAAAERMRRRAGERRSDDERWDGRSRRSKGVKRKERSWERDEWDGDYSMDDEERWQGGGGRERRRSGDKETKHGKSRSGEHSSRKRKSRARSRSYERDDDHDRDYEEDHDRDGKRGGRRRAREEDDERVISPSRRSPSRSSTRARSTERDDNSSRDHRRSSHRKYHRRRHRSKRSHSRSNEEQERREGDPRSRSRSPSHSHSRSTLAARESKTKHKHRTRTRGRSRTPASEYPQPPHSKVDDLSSPRTPPSVASPVQSPTYGPHPPPAPPPPSKMDKYFDESYDPRLDIAPLAVPKVPATGLINNAEFEGWDAMLELIRIRREDKEEKKRRERLGLGKETLGKKKVMSDGIDDRWASGGVSIMDIEYKKKGSVREWDMGKEGL